MGSGHRPLYGDLDTTFPSIRSVLASLGYGSAGWIVGEALYNDEIEAQTLRNLIDATHQQVWYLTQWPLHRVSTCPQGAPADVAAPVLFNYYRARGF